MSDPSDQTRVIWLDLEMGDQGADDQLLREIDTTRAHPARVYDFWLGGKDNYPADQQLASQIEATVPQIRESVRQQRRFLARAVRFMAATSGVRQFLDIGTGIPTTNNTHEVAQAVDPSCRVVYVDNHPMVLAHARALLRSEHGRTAFLEADLRDTGTILEHAARKLDFTEPIGVLLLGILQLIPDSDNPAGVVRRLVDAVPAGSFLVIAQPAADVDADKTAAGYAEFNRNSEVPLQERTHAEVLQFFAGTKLVEPGLVQVSQWRPLPGAQVEVPVPIYGGVGLKVHG